MYTYQWLQRQLRNACQVLYFMIVMNDVEAPWQVISMNRYLHMDAESFLWLAEMQSWNPSAIAWWQLSFFFLCICIHLQIAVCIWIGIAYQVPNRTRCMEKEVLACNRIPISGIGESWNVHGRYYLVYTVVTWQQNAICNQIKNTSC